jgi:hypothetical protein
MWKKFKKAVRKVVGAVLKVANVARELAVRLAGALDWVASLVGLRPRKHLRLQVYIIDDEKGNPVADKERVKAWVADAARVYLEQANVKLHPDRDEFVNYLSEKPPKEAIIVKECSFSEGFSDAADFFQDHARNPVFGYGGPITAFVVGTIGNAQGCSWWWMEPFLIVRAGANRLDLAHEIGHVCGLRDMNVTGDKYLMQKDGVNGERMTNAQIAFLRNARYVTYLDTRGV